MRTFVIFLLILISCKAFAQDTLPRISVAGISNKVIISWTNPFSSLTTLNIQRSYDSTKNFKTIGSILDVKNKRNGFVDSRPLSDHMFYRVFISFEGGAYIFSKSSRPVKDTISAFPSVKQLQQSNVATWFVLSPHVYTGRDNNVIISLPDEQGKKYSLKFFEENGTPSLEISKITDPYLTLEKVNFSHAGIFNFELYDDGKLVEKNKVYIAKDGKITGPGPLEQGRLNR